MSKSFSRRTAWLVVLATVAVGCAKGKEEAPKVGLGEPPADSVHAGVAKSGMIAGDAKIALDSGNVLFRKKAYPEALAEYRIAAQRAPEHAAPLFGIYMAAQAMKNTKLADSALAGIRARNAPSPSAHAFGDSTMNKAHAGVKGAPIS